MVSRARVEEASKGTRAPGEPALAIEVGKSLSADKVIRGTVSRAGQGYDLEMEIIDVATGISEGRYVTQFACGAQELPICLTAAASALSGCRPVVSSGGSGGAQAHAAGQAKETGSPFALSSEPLDLDLVYSRLSPQDRKKLDYFRFEKSIGYLIGVPSWIWTGFFVVATAANIVGGGEWDYWAGFLVYSLPAIVGSSLAAGMVINGQKGILRLAKKAEGVQLGLRIDPRRDAYGLSISFAF